MYCTRIFRRPKEAFPVLTIIKKCFIILPVLGKKNRITRLLGGAVLALFLLGALPLGAQEAASQGEEVSGVGESCLSVNQQRREICKKSAETCTDVHTLEALNLIKTCAQLAQECDQLGTKEDEICQPGGNGRVTNIRKGTLAKPPGVL